MAELERAWRIYSATVWFSLFHVVLISCYSLLRSFHFVSLIPAFIASCAAIPLTFTFVKLFTVPSYRIRWTVLWILSVFDRVTLVAFSCHMLWAAILFLTVASHSISVIPPAVVTSITLLAMSARVDAMTLRPAPIPTRIFDAIRAPLPASAMYTTVVPLAPLIALRLVFTFPLFSVLPCAVLAGLLHVSAIHCMHAVFTCPCRSAMPTPQLFMDALALVQARRPLLLSHYLALADIEALVATGGLDLTESQLVSSEPHPAAMAGPVTAMVPAPTTDSPVALWAAVHALCSVVLAVHLEEMLDQVRASNPAVHDKIATRLIKALAEVSYCVDTGVAVDRLRHELRPEPVSAWAKRLDAIARTYPSLHTLTGLPGLLRAAALTHGVVSAGQLVHLCAQIDETVLATAAIPASFGPAAQTHLALVSTATQCTKELVELTRGRPYAVGNAGMSVAARARAARAVGGSRLRNRMHYAMASYRGLLKRHKARSSRIVARFM
ncbi:Prokaryotic membrane lipoprotein lipid attachment site [Carpediemonas membranifera]|uniref:Prokaryotic membrane lipoprotein lipid attachment site n=1 Tax=Carpediemonas membranifera TaxID=201153 RepID=A0A8J6E4N0_9EUKA|nr:Prokaryotic membrane lipoprotein lipid attachment site [Carpediemonas membranifera]|eukprot:KAG9394702.1 Prokaryotic membrane lipoprotein lipid attachment site [Carpediemonas membranifera]